MFKLRSRLTAACGAVVILVTPLISAADVKSMSLERFKNVGQERYWEVSLICSGDSAEKLMKRVVGSGNKWCSSADSSLCDDSKFALSRTICGGGEPDVAEASGLNSSTNISDKANVETKAAEATAAVNNESLTTDSRLNEAKRTELLKEQVQIEEQRIQIEQKRLELMQSELALKKQLEQN